MRTCSKKVTKYVVRFVEWQKNYLLLFIVPIFAKLSYFTIWLRIIQINATHAQWKFQIRKRSIEERMNSRAGCALFVRYFDRGRLSWASINCAKNFSPAKKCHRPRGGSKWTASDGEIRIDNCIDFHGTSRKANGIARIPLLRQVNCCMERAIHALFIVCPCYGWRLDINILWLQDIKCFEFILCAYARKGQVPFAVMLEKAENRSFSVLKKIFFGNFEVFAEVVQWKSYVWINRSLLLWEWSMVKI